MYGCAHWILLEIVIGCYVLWSIDSLTTTLPAGFDGEFFKDPKVPASKPKMPDENEPIHFRYACEGFNLTMQCRQGFEIQVLSAFYGVDRVGLCTVIPQLNHAPCGDYVNTELKIKQFCQGAQSCRIPVCQETLGLSSLKCRVGFKFLEAYFQCGLKEGYCRNGELELLGCDDVCYGLKCRDNSRAICVPNKCNQNVGCYPEFRDAHSGRFVRCDVMVDTAFDPPRYIDMAEWTPRPPFEGSEHLSGELEDSVLTVNLTDDLVEASGGVFVECGSGLGDGLSFLTEGPVADIMECAERALQARLKDPFVNAVAVSAFVSYASTNHDQLMLDCFIKHNQTTFYNENENQEYDNCYLD